MSIQSSMNQALSIASLLYSQSPSGKAFAEEQRLAKKEKALAEHGKKLAEKPGTTKEEIKQNLESIQQVAAQKFEVNPTEKNLSGREQLKKLTASDYFRSLSKDRQFDIIYKVVEQLGTVGDRPEDIEAVLSLAQEEAFRTSTFFDRKRAASALARASLESRRQEVNSSKRVISAMKGED